MKMIEVSRAPCYKRRKTAPQQSQQSWTSLQYRKRDSTVSVHAGTIVVNISVLIR